MISRTSEAGPRSSALVPIVRGAWVVAAVAGAAKVSAALAALAAPGSLTGTTSAGVPYAAQAGAMVVCTLAALAVSASAHPVRLAWAGCWSLGGAAFASPVLIRAGWPDPPIEIALWIAVPVALVLPAAVAGRGKLSRRHRVLTALAAGALALVALAPALPGPFPAPYFATLALAAALSVAALRPPRRPHGV